MSYLVLARKYRPQTFAEVVGQEHVTRTLANAFAAGRVHHAFLFCGPRGCGKTTTARILGKALNCATGPGAEPCGTCDACRTIAAGTAVDYHEMDGASNRGIDAIRELTDAVRYQPAALRKKVYVIDEVHMLTTEAFNALLKTLEEPPPHVTFILATTEPHKIPNTILSRCQRYDFKLVASSRLALHLREIFEKEGLVAEPGALELVVREAGGSVRDALSLCDQVISYVGQGAIAEAQVAEVLGVADRALTRTLVEALGAGDAGGALAAVDAATSRGLDEVQIARALVRYLRDVAVLQAAPGQLELVAGSEDEKAEVVAMAASLERGRVRLMFDRMLEACEELAETHETRMVLDLALIDLAAVEPLVPLGDLIERLGEMERRIGGSGGGRAAPAGGGGAKAGGREAGGTSTSRSMVSSPSTSPSPSTPPSTSRASAPPSPSPSPSTPPSTSRASAVPDRIASPSPAPVPRTESAAPSVQGTPVQGTPVREAVADPLRAWAEVIGALEEARELSLASVYQGAKVLAWTGRRIELGFPKDAMLGELATEPAKVESLKTFLARYLGAPHELVIRLLAQAEIAAAPSALSIVEAEAQRKQADREHRVIEARAHPLTQVVLETFGAEIKEIKTDV